MFELSFPGELVTSNEWVLTFTDGPATGRVFVLTQANATEGPRVREAESEYFVPGGAALTQPGETRVVELLAPDATGVATLCSTDETACDPIEIVE